MEWQFRKALESFEAYKKTASFKSQIEKGDANVLKMTIREIQIVLSEPKQKIISKVLALRFARDIMVLGREDVVQAVQKLVPQILKICSYDLESDDPNRGETYFHQHPSYLMTSDQEVRNEIDQLGSTYLILALESILHWAKWVPLDESNKESIFSKAYEDLLERGVTFPKTFHYYKQSDTQKYFSRSSLIFRFRNTYRVEFFTDSYNSSLVSASGDSRVKGSSSRKLINGHSNNRIRGKEDVQNSADIEIFQRTSITTVGQMKQYLESLYNDRDSSDQSSIDKKLSIINKRLQQTYDQEFTTNNLYKNKAKKDQKNWVDKFLINYGIYSSNKLSYKDFLNKMTTEEFVLEGNQLEESLSILKSGTKYQENESHMKMYKSPRKQLPKSTPQQLLRKQEYEFKSKTYELKCQLQDKQNQIDRLKRYHEKQKAQLSSDYERRMEYLKKDLAVSKLSSKQQKEGPLLLELEFQNQQLKKKIVLIEKQLMNTHTVREEQMEEQNGRLRALNQKLRLENEKLINMINEKNVSEYETKLQASNVRNIPNQKLLNKEYAYNSNIKLDKVQSQLEDKREVVRRLQKTIINLQDQLQLYKTELATERNKTDQKSGALFQKSDYLASQNTALKEKLYQAKKTIDIKDVELLDMKEEVRRYQARLKDFSQKRSQWSQVPSLKTEKGFGNTLNVDRQRSASKYSKIDPFQQLASNRRIKFNNYEDLYTELKPSNKESFLRLCRASFKKKDVLFKQNELEVGIITELVPGFGGDRLNFLLHLTNVADKQIDNIKIQPLAAQGSFISSLEYQLDLKYIFCIQPQEQQKVSIIVINKETPYIKDRAVVTIQYEQLFFQCFSKNGTAFSHNIFLPFMIPKFLINTPPSKTPSNPRYVTEEIVLRYTKKMIPKPSYLKTYFENISQVQEDKKYQVEFYNKETDLNMFIVFSFGENETLHIMATILRERLNEKQKYVMQQALGFMEVAFRK